MLDLSKCNPYLLKSIGFYQLAVSLDLVYSNVCDAFASDLLQLHPIWEIFPRGESFLLALSVHLAVTTLVHSLSSCTNFKNFSLSRFIFAFLFVFLQKPCTWKLLQA